MADLDETIKYTADVAVTTTDGYVLLIKRGWAPFKNMWALPGGHVNKGETARAAGARELAEEAGVYASPGELTPVGVADTPDRDPRGRYISVVFRLVVLPGTEIQPGDDAVQARWWPLEELPPLAFDHADIIAVVTDAD